MKITFVAKRNINYDYERYKIFEFNNREENPFFEMADPGEQIGIDNLALLISSSPINPVKRELRAFILNAIIDGYKDIRYYYS